MSEIQASDEAKPSIYKRRWGDRKDGRLLRSIEPIAIFSLYIMNTRNDANNSVSDCVELSAIDKYVHKKRQQGFEGFNVMYVLVAAYVRTVSQKPGINRFINGHRIYARNNIEVSLMVKKKLALNAPETMFKFFLSLNIPSMMFIRICMKRFIPIRMSLIQMFPMTLITS